MSCGSFDFGFCLLFLATYLSIITSTTPTRKRAKQTPGPIAAMIISRLSGPGPGVLPTRIKNHDMQKRIHITLTIPGYSTSVEFAWVLAAYIYQKVNVDIINAELSFNIPMSFMIV